MIQDSVEIKLIQDVAQALIPLIRYIFTIKGPFQSNHFYNALESRGLHKNDYKKCLQILEGQGDIKILSNKIYFLGK